MLMGVNLSGAEFGSNVPGQYGVDYTYPTTDELDYYASKGLALIRLPFDWERMQPTLGGALDPGEVSRMRGFLDSAAARGLDVVIDAQSFGRYQGHTIGSAEVPVSSFSDFWTKMATIFVGQPGVWGYDLANEPHDMGSPTAWPDAAQAAVDGIRSVDMTTRVIVEGDDWSHAADWATANAALNIHDPAGHLLYEAHQYFDRDQSGTYKGNYDQEGAYPTMGADDLKPFVTWLAQHNAQGYIGEYGVPGNDPRWLAVLDNFMAAVKQAGLPGTYWSAGPWWGNYPLSVEPTNGADKPQMAILEKYPSTGTAAMTSITVHASGDSWNGDPAFALSADGNAVGTATVNASHRAGAWQDLTFTADLGSAGPSQLALTFTNDAWGGSAATDRNLYIDYVEVNGHRFEGETALSNTAALGYSAVDPHAAVMMGGGTVTFAVSGSAAAVTPVPTPTPAPVPTAAPTPAAGPVLSTVTVQASGDSWNGNPTFHLTADGHVLGDATVTGSHHDGTWQDLTFTADLGATGPGQVALTFTNDAWGGNSAADRNLYIDWIEVNGHRFEGEAASNNAALGYAATDPHAAVMMGGGTVTFATGGSAPATAQVAPQPDQLTLQVSGDSWNGAPHLKLYVDNQAVGEGDVTAAHSVGQWQILNFSGDFAATAHDVRVDFINDAYGGAGADRNLYVDDISINGQRLEGEAAASNTASLGQGAVDPHAGVMLVAGSLLFHTPADWWH